MNKVCAINLKLPSKLFIFWQSKSAEKKQFIVSYIIYLIKNTTSIKVNFSPKSRTDDKMLGTFVTSQ